MEVFAISNLVSEYRMNGLYWDYFQGEWFGIRTSGMSPKLGIIEKEDRKGRGGQRGAFGDEHILAILDLENLYFVEKCIPQALTSNFRLRSHKRFLVEWKVSCVSSDRTPILVHTLRASQALELEISNPRGIPCLEKCFNAHLNHL